MEPIGGARSDFQTALLALVVASSAPRKKGSRQPKFKDYVPEFWKRRGRDADPRSMLAFAEAFTRGVGGTVGENVREALSEPTDEVDGGARP